MIFLGGERDLPYRMTSGRALKLNSSPTNPLLITLNKKRYILNRISSAWRLIAARCVWKIIRMQIFGWHIRSTHTMFAFDLLGLNSKVNPSNLLFNINDNNLNHSPRLSLKFFVANFKSLTSRLLSKPYVYAAQNLIVWE